MVWARRARHEMRPRGLLGPSASSPQTSSLTAHGSASSGREKKTWIVLTHGNRKHVLQDKSDGRVAVGISPTCWWWWSKSFAEEAANFIRQPARLHISISQSSMASALSQPHWSLLPNSNADVAVRVPLRWRRGVSCWFLLAITALPGPSWPIALARRPR